MTDPRRTTALFLAIAGLASCASPQLTAYEQEQLSSLRLEAPSGTPDSAEGNGYWDDPGAIELGHALYFDQGLSRSGETTCNTCHIASESGADPRGGPTSLDDFARPSHRNAPTILNSGLRAAYSWTSARTQLWAQIGAPLKGPFHGWTTPETPPGTAEYEVESWVCLNYAEDYEDVFGEACEVRDGADGDAPTFDNITRAIAAYVHVLESRNSPFDRFIGAPDDDPDFSCMSDSAVRGARLFVGKASCNECHSGPTLSDGKRYYLGLGDEFEVVPEDELEPGDDSVRILRYQTPTLRQIAETGPYMHDGSRENLADVLRFYKYGGGDEHVDLRAPEMYPLDLTDEDLLDLQSFLEQLTGAPLDYCLTHAPMCCEDGERVSTDDERCPAPVVRPEPMCP